MKTHIVCDLQFGSTGKGLYAGHLAMLHRPTLLVTAWMPNAGHTFIDEDGRKYVHSMLANGVVSSSVNTVLIGPGSVINMDGLFEECNAATAQLQDAGHGDREITIKIHANAALRLERHIEKEGGMIKIGSTMKGCGAAVIEKIERNPEFDITMQSMYALGGVGRVGIFNIQVVSHYDYLKEFNNHSVCIVEGAQGYSLGINSGIYPYTTSRECTPQQIASDCALPMDALKSACIHGTMRTFPIRVANRHDADGKMIGTSGPGYCDQEEITWDQLRIEPEKTTVTKLPRRVFTFSMQQFTEAYMHTRPDHLFLNFVNYMTHDSLIELLETKIIPVVVGCRPVTGSDFLLPMTFGHGPKVTDLHDVCAVIRRGRLQQLIESF